MASVQVAVAYLPGLTEAKLSPAELATGCARRNLGKVVRVDYADPGAFVYLAYATEHARSILGRKRGQSVFLRGAWGDGMPVRFLQAKGWDRGMRSEPPVALTDEVVSYDVDCPDAGEGPWTNWESKVTAVAIEPEGHYGIADPHEEPEVVLLRCRRWERVEPSRGLPRRRYWGAEHAGTVYGRGLGGNLFALLEQAGGARVVHVQVTQSPITHHPGPEQVRAIADIENQLRTLEARLAIGPRRDGSPTFSDSAGSTSPPSPEDGDTDDEDDAGDNEDRFDRPTPGAEGQHYEFDTARATHDQRAEIEWASARLAALVLPLGGDVTLHRSQ